VSEQTPPIDGETFVNQILERFQRDRRVKYKKVHKITVFTGTDTMSIKNQDSIAVDRSTDEEFDFLDDNIDIAVKNAQQHLIDRGISYVYSLDDLIIQHYPDGSEDILQHIDLDPDDPFIVKRCIRI
jgi:hypothetical protein